MSIKSRITKQLLPILFSLVSSCAMAQTKYSLPSEDVIKFHNSISKAERMYKNDSALNAFAWFDIAFNNYKGVIHPSHYFNAARCALKIKEEYQALTFLEKAIVNGYVLDSLQKSFLNFNNQNTKNEYRGNLPKWELERDKFKNKIWENELLASVESTKKYTTPTYKTAIEYCITCLKDPKCSKIAPAYTGKYRLVKEKMKADSLLASLLIQRISQYGFPSIKLLNRKAVEVASNIILNFDADKKNEIMNPILFKALNEGQISPAFYAQLVDKRNLMNGVPPEFYEPINGYEKTIGKDIGNVNLKRNAIGLYNIILPNPTALKNMNKKDPKTASKVYLNLYDY